MDDCVIITVEHQPWCPIIAILRDPEAERVVYTCQGSASVGLSCCYLEFLSDDRNIAKVRVTA